MNLFLKRVTALFLGSILTMVFAEFALSRSSLVDSPPGQYRRSETRAFEHRPGFRGRDKLGNLIVINSQGLREEDYPLEKPEGVYRILVLGDSVTFGENVAAEESFPKQMQHLLNEARTGPKVEVLNAGVRGYNTYQELLMLEEVGLLYDPDLVIVCYVVNDADPFSNQAGLINPKYKRLIALKEFVKRHSYLYAFLKRLFVLAKTRTKPGSVEDTTLGHFSEGDPGWLASYASLEEIKQVTGERGVRFMMAVMPQIKGIKPGDTYPERNQRIHDRILKAGRDLGIDTVDLLPVLQGHDPEALKIFSKDTLHPNPLGHRLLAEKLSGHIRAEYLKTGEGQG